MQLILKKPLEELIPAMISWNNEELKKDVLTRLEQFKGIVYDDNQITAAKVDRALLNKFSKALNDERLRIKKLYEEPYIKFKGEVDEVISLVDKTVSEIDGQIKAYEEQREDEKQYFIQEYFDAVIKNLASFVKLEQIQNPKWLNSSFNIKNAFAEIDERVLQIRNDITTIEALKSDDEANIKAFYFRNLSLSSALMENERLKAERAKISEITATKQPSNEVSINTENTPNTQTATFTLAFEVTATKEQLQALKNFFIAQKISYRKI